VCKHVRTLTMRKYTIPSVYSDRFDAGVMRAKEGDPWIGIWLPICFGGFNGSVNCEKEKGKGGGR
jgi:hypothetical protein